jgi:predicted DNA-binding helix-hairpin-helix protein
VDTSDRLLQLAEASRFDLACACGTRDNSDHRRRGSDGMWLYPVSLPGGGTSIMLKTLLSSACINDCRYCPLRAGRDVPRCSLTPEEIAATVMDYWRRRQIFGLFLSSAVTRHPDHTMDRMVATAELLRHRHGFRGFIHLKVIPGASEAAVVATLRVANAVSLNLEAPNRRSFRQLGGSKDYDRDVVGTVKLISRLTAPGGPFARVKHTTQFVVGAADETDAELVEASGRLYRRWGMQRIYFSAYQRGLGDPDLPGERAATSPHELLTREHRLYQVDFLLRRYGFSAAEIPVDAAGRLDLEVDPKTAWARAHPERFPLDPNTAGREELLRVPGLGPKTVGFLLEARGNGARFRCLEDLGRVGRRLAQARPFLRF